MKGSGQSVTKFLNSKKRSNRVVPEPESIYEVANQPLQLEEIDFDLDETPNQVNKPNIGDILHHVSPGMAKHMNSENLQNFIKAHPNIAKSVIPEIFKEMTIQLPELLKELSNIINEIYNLKDNINIKKILFNCEKNKFVFNYIYGENLNNHISFYDINTNTVTFYKNINDDLHIKLLKQAFIQNLLKLKDLEISHFQIFYNQYNVVFNKYNQTFFQNNAENNYSYKTIKSYNELKKYAIEKEQGLEIIFNLFDRFVKQLHLIKKLLDNKSEKMIQHFITILLQPPPAPHTSPVSQGGKITLRKSSEKVKIGNKERLVYLGEHNKKYIKMNKQIIALKDVKRST